jgi:hypothetical protein
MAVSPSPTRTIFYWQKSKAILSSCRTQEEQQWPQVRLQLPCDELYTPIAPFGKYFKILLNQFRFAN